MVRISVAPFRDRVVHHALINILEPIFEKSFIYHSYATRKNKGTHKAIKFAQNCFSKNYWYLKMDIKKYFDSINHAILNNILAHKIKDTYILKLCRLIISRDDIYLDNLVFRKNHELTDFTKRQRFAD